MLEEEIVVLEDTDVTELVVEALDIVVVVVLLGSMVETISSNQYYVN